MAYSTTYFLPYSLLVLLLTAALCLLPKYAKPVGVALLSSVVGYFFYSFFRLRFNGPYLDDLDVLLAMLKVLDAPNASAFWEAITAQHNTHRVATVRGWFWLQQWLTGSFQLTQLMLLGVLHLVGVFGLFWHVSKHISASYGLHRLLPVALLFFSLLFFDNVFWSMASLQNNAVLLYAFGALYLLLVPQRAWCQALAAVLGIGAAYTSGNGLMVFPIGAFLLLYQRQYKMLGLWALVGTLTYVAFFTNYIFYRQGTLPLFLGNLKHNLANVLLLLGSVAYQINIKFMNGALPHKIYYLASVLGGALGVGFVIYQNLYYYFPTVFNQNKRLRNSMRQKPQLWLFLMAAQYLVLISVLLIATSYPIVAPGKVWDIFVPNRYVIYSVLFFCLLYVAVSQVFEIRFVFVGALILAAFLNIVSYWRGIYEVTDLAAQKHLDGFYLREEQMLYSEGQLYQEKHFWNHPTAFLGLMADLKKRQLFEYAPTPIDALLPIKLDNKPSKKLDSVVVSATQIDFLMTAQTIEQVPIAQVLTNAQHTFCVPYIDAQNRILKDDFPNLRVAKLSQLKIAKGQYRLYTILQNGQTGKFNVANNERAISIDSLSAGALQK
jgi:hypothetical protein